MTFSVYLKNGLKVVYFLRVDIYTFITKTKTAAFKPRKGISW